MYLRRSLRFSPFLSGRKCPTKLWKSLTVRSQYVIEHIEVNHSEIKTRHFWSTSSASYSRKKADESKGKKTPEMSPQEQQVRAEVRRQLKSASRMFEDEKCLDLDVFETYQNDCKKSKEEKLHKTEKEIKIEPYNGSDVQKFGKVGSGDVFDSRDKASELQITPDMFEYYPPRCPGCGAFFQSTEPSKSGFIASPANPNQTKKLFTEENRQVMCKRCFDAKHYNKPSYLQTSNDEIVKQLSFIERKKGLILYIVNVMDIYGSMFPQLLQVVGDSKRLLIVGNKVDILPVNETPGHQADKMKNAIVAACLENGLSHQSNIRDVLLVSAKTGFGLRHLANAIQDNWDNNGDVYLMGCTNVGKTTLFNVMLDLLSAHKRKGDMLNRAVVSLWPGMSLSLLRFPMSYYQLVRLRNRLAKGPLKFYEKNHPRDKGFGPKSDVYDEYHEKGHNQKSLFSKYVKDKEEIIEIDSDIIDVSQTSFKKYVDNSVQKRALVPRSNINMTSNLQGRDIDVFGKPELVSGDKDYQHRQTWLYDTPGIFNDNQIYPLLTIDELKLLHPAEWLVPHTYILNPGQTMLIGGLARLDYLDIKIKPNETAPGQDPDDISKANRSAFFTVLASPNLPLHILGTHKADDVYARHAGEELLKIPMGGKERMAKFPPLESEEFVIDGLEWWDSSADVVLSSIGWVAVTTGRKYKILVRAFTPQGRGLRLRQPAMLPTLVRQKGQRGIKYQGHIDYHGYQATRSLSPNWQKYFNHENEATYQWMKECKVREKEQRREIKLLKIEEVCRKSLEGLPNFVTKNYPDKNKKLETGTQEPLQLQTDKKVEENA